MQFDQLRALAAVIDEGGFDRAATRLHVSGSAVSQRIKALEEGVGQVLVHRTVPTRPTEAGEVVLAMARQVDLLEAETRAALSQATGERVQLRVVVNADTLATWFVDVLAEVADWPDCTLRFEVEDQGYSADLLRRGEVLAAVTSDPAPVSGCSTEHLGAMRYLPMASPRLLRRHTSGGRIDWQAMPTIRFNRKDDLQSDFLARFGPVTAPAAQVPSAEGFLAAVRAGLGWGMIPEGMLGDEVSSGRLEPLPGPATEVQLYWRCWRLRSERLERLTDAVRTASAVLRNPE